MCLKFELKNMTKLLEVVKLSIVFSFITPSYSGRNDDYCSATPSIPHYTNLIVGGGPAGLYTAWRLSSQHKHEPTAIYEWSPVRLGGRVITKVFSGGQSLELGAMRFMTHQLVLQKVLKELNLTDYITDFHTSSNPLYYLRGKHVYQNEIPQKGVPYNTIHNKDDPNSLFGDLSEQIAGTINRAQSCRFFDEGVFPANITSKAYNKNDLLGNIGYWNLLVDQLGSEGFQYAADASRYDSNVVNGNAAYMIRINEDYSTSVKFKRLKPGYSTLINKLAEECVKNQVKIRLGKRLTKFYWNAQERKFYSTFMKYDRSGAPSLDTFQVTSDRLFLCVPRRPLETIEETDVVGDWPVNLERRVLKHSQGQFYISAVIPQPAYKIGLMYDYPWWLNATYKPDIEISKNNYSLGPSVTELPLRQIFYFGNNNKDSSKPMYGLFASYSDMRETYFWEELEIPPDESLCSQNPSFFLQPLFSPAKVTEVMQKIVQEQLNSVHFKASEGMKVPLAKEGYFMDWGHDPYGAGYYRWKAHRKIAETQYYMTRPSEAIGVDVPVHVAGSAYAWDQSWIEGAFTTAEAVLVDKIGLRPLAKLPKSYPLICYPRFTGQNY